MPIGKIAVTAALLGAACVLQGCLAMSATGAVVDVTGAVVVGAAKGGAAVGRAIIPGDSRDDD